LLLRNTNFCVTNIISGKEEEFISHVLEEVSICMTILFYELVGEQSSRVGEKRRNLCPVWWRRWPGRKSGLMTSLLYEQGGVQSSRVGGRRRSLCHACWRRWPGRKKRFSGLIKERLNITPSFPKFFS
jgi:hypothetical protein